MQLVIDSREAVLFDNCRLIANELKIEKKMLALGDAEINYDDTTVAIVERKTVNDLLSSIKDGRYREQSYRLSNLYKTVYYFIEGAITTHDHQTVYSAIFSLSALKGFSVIRTMDVKETSKFLVGLSLKCSKSSELCRPETTAAAAATDANEYCNVVKKIKKDNITPANFGQIVLSQIPGVSDKSATSIIKHYKTLRNLLDDPNKEDVLSKLTYETEKGQTRKLSKNVVQSVNTFLTSF